MSPEEEAKLRAALAKAREEATIDLDEEETVDLDQVPSGQLLSPAQLAALEARKNAAQESMDAFAEKAGRTLRPFYGLAPGGPINPAVLYYTDKKAQEAANEEKMDVLSEREENIRRAMENAKRMAAAKEYKEKQEKATRDRDETIESGGRGYRVERALYPSDLYRK